MSKIIQCDGCSENKTPEQVKKYFFCEDCWDKYFDKPKIAINPFGFKKQTPEYMLMVYSQALLGLSGEQKFSIITALDEDINKAFSLDIQNKTTKSLDNYYKNKLREKNKEISSLKDEVFELKKKLEEVSNGVSNE